jgi:hypothetical protein
MQIIIDQDASYLFRPGNLRDLTDTLEEVIAADDGCWGNVHRQRLCLMIDLLDALKRAAKEAAR